MLKRSGKGTLFGCVALLLASIVLADVLCFDPQSCSNGISHALFFVAPAAVIVVPIGMLCFAVLRTVINHWLSLKSANRWLWTVAGMLTIWIVGDAFKASRPTTILRRLVVDPVPASVHALRISRLSSFSDGDAWFFVFNLSPEDFPAIVSSRGFQRIYTASLSGPSVDITNLGDNRTSDVGDLLDQRLKNCGKAMYARPEKPEIYCTGKHILVTNADHKIVFVLIDQFMDPFRSN